MNIIRKNFIVGLILIVIQLSITKALDAKKRIPVNEIRKSKETDSNKLIQEIDSLISHVADCSESILKLEQQIISNPEIHSRRRRSNEPQKLNPNVLSKIKHLESNARSMKENVGAMKNASNYRGTSERLDSLETIMDELQNLFDNKVKVMAAHLINSKNWLNTLTTTLESLQQELDNVKQTFQVQQEIPKYLKNKIIEDIKSRDFNSAASSLDKLTGDLQKYVNFIVHEVYNNQATNYEIISLFANTTNLEQNVAIYKALRFEMEINGDNDYQRILRIIQSLKSKISDDDESSILHAAETFTDKLHDFVAKTLEANLTETIKNSDNTTNIIEILDSIRLKYPDFFSDFLKENLNNVIVKTGSTTFIKFFEDDNFSTLNVWIYSAVFNLFNMTDSIDQEETVHLAFALKKAWRNLKLDTDSAKEAEKVRSGLPKSVEILAFGSEILCIKNQDYNEFLFVNNDDGELQAHTRKRSNSWTLDSGWVIEPYGNGYNLKFYRKDIYMFMNPRNSITFITIPPGSTNLNMFNWVFSPKGEYVYIKNSLYNEFLSASSLEIEDLRSVYTYALANNNNYPNNPLKESLWSVEECNQYNEIADVSN